MSDLMKSAWAALLLGALSCGAFFATPCFAEEKLEVRAFRLQHRPVMDGAELAEAVLSDEGSLKIRPRIRTIVVEDYASVLTKVESLLDDYDIPPRNVLLTLNLIVGTDERAGEAGRTIIPPGLGPKVVDVMERLKIMTKWSRHKIEGSRSIQGIEGGEAIAMLSDDYRVVVEIDSVDEERNSVKFKRLSLQQRKQTQTGDRFDDVLVTSVITPLDRLKLLGVTSNPEASKALFLTLQAELR